MAKPADLLAQICSVPGTDEPLEFAADASSRAASGAQFRAVRGVPILRDEADPLVTKPEPLVTSGVSAESVDHMCSLPGYTLFLGAGNTRFRHPNVVEVEYHLFTNTDVVADGHLLPFQSNTFDLFFAMNVFEHLSQPFVAAREALRVLKPHGELHIHTAFLQPLHEAPVHYFNATEFGAREWFKDFEQLECRVSENFNPLYSIAWISEQLLSIVKEDQGKKAARKIGELTLAEAAHFWEHPEGWDPAAFEILSKLPETAQRAIAAGFDVRARKPAS